jgi:hypothetical protein
LGILIVKLMAFTHPYLNPGESIDTVELAEIKRRLIHGKPCLDELLEERDEGPDGPYKLAADLLVQILAVQPETRIGVSPGPITI